MNKVVAWMLNWLGSEEVYEAGKREELAADSDDDLSDSDDDGEPSGDSGKTKRTSQNYRFGTADEVVGKLTLESKKTILLKFVQKLTNERVIDDLLRCAKESTNSAELNIDTEFATNTNHETDTVDRLKPRKTKKSEGFRYTVMPDNLSDSDEETTTATRVIPNSGVLKFDTSSAGTRVRITRESSEECRSGSPKQESGRQKSTNAFRSLGSIKQVDEIDQLLTAELKWILKVYDVPIAEFEKEALKCQVKDLWYREMQ